MKRLFLSMGLALLAFMVVPASAAPTQLLTVTVSNATVTVPSFQAFPYNQPLQNFAITHGPLTNLTSLSIPIYASFQGVNTNGRVLLGTWYPSNTNAATEIIYGANYIPTNWLSVDVVTTNSVPLGGTYGN